MKSTKHQDHPSSCSACFQKQAPSRSPLRSYFCELQRELSQSLKTPIHDVQIENDNAHTMPAWFCHSFSMSTKDGCCGCTDAADEEEHDDDDDFDFIFDISFREERWETPDHSRHASECLHDSPIAGTRRPPTCKSAFKQKVLPPAFPYRQESL